MLERLEIGNAAGPNYVTQVHTMVHESLESPKALRVLWTRDHMRSTQARSVSVAPGESMFVVCYEFCCTMILLYTNNPNDVLLGCWSWRQTGGIRTAHRRSAAPLFISPSIRMTYRAVILIAAYLFASLHSTIAMHHAPSYTDLRARGFLCVGLCFECTCSTLLYAELCCMIQQY